MTATYDDIRKALLDAALPHVPFDGWTETTLPESALSSSIGSNGPTPLCPTSIVALEAVK